MDGELAEDSLLFSKVSTKMNRRAWTKTTVKKGVAALRGTSSPVRFSGLSTDFQQQPREWGVADL